MSGFEPPSGRRSYVDSGFVPPSRAGQASRPPIKHFSSGNSQDGVGNNTTASLPQPSSGGSSFFGFRKRSTPAAPSTPSDSPTSNYASSYNHGSNQGGAGPAPGPRRLSSRELVPAGSGGMSSNNTSSSHEVMLVDPYSMPRDPPEKPLPVPAPPTPTNQRPTHSSTPSASSVATNATASTARPRPLHPEIRSLIALNAARKSCC